LAYFCKKTKNYNPMKILAVETSCDETAASVVSFSQEKIDIQSSIISSQIKIHEKWGGVVPNLAAREHLKNIIPVINESLQQAHTNLSEIDLLAVTHGPGLIPALLIGTNTAKTLSYFSEKPLIGINHIEAHIYANFFSENKKILNNFEFPILALVISGGHTQLVLIKDYLKYEIIGETQDDAVGEAFDKVAKILGLGYPGGPIISKTADETKDKKIEAIKSPEIKKLLEEIKFPRPMIDSGDLNFSYSGLKTSVMYFFKKIIALSPSKEDLDISKKLIAKNFQEAAIEVLIKKSQKAIEKYQAKTFFLAGGVAANSYLRNQVSEKIKIPFNFPPLNLCGDNAAMIAISAFYQ
jgi:N6-L-threonylcarbamoyladenine synthase